MMAEANGFIVIAGSVFVIAGSVFIIAGWILGFGTRRRGRP